MTRSAETVLGSADDPAFAGAERDYVEVEWFDATKPRLRLTSESGLEIRTDLLRGSFLADGAVLRHDGGKIVVVRRKASPACRITFDAGAPAGEAFGEAALIGHAAGNQHLPIDASGGEIRIPVLTSESLVSQTLEALGLEAASYSFAELALFADHPPPGGGHGPGS